MYNPSVTRFIEYVEKTSRPDVWGKRKEFVRQLCEGNYPSILQLVTAAGGNRRDREWLSQALRDGAIKIGEGGFLRLGDRPQEEQRCTREQAWTVANQIMRWMQAEPQETPRHEALMAACGAMTDVVRTFG